MTVTLNSFRVILNVKLKRANLDSTVVLLCNVKLFKTLKSNFKSFMFIQFQKKIIAVSDQNVSA